MSNVFWDRNIKEVSDQELEEKMADLGKQLGVRAVQLKHAQKDCDKADNRWTKMESAKAKTIDDMEKIGTEVERRKGNT